MSFDVSTAMNIILFLALIPISYFWLRRAWRILFKRDFSEVALKHGEAPPNQLPDRLTIGFEAAISLVHEP